jgi:hypothetical protein
MIISVEIRHEIQAELVRRGGTASSGTNGEAFDKERAQAAGTRIRELRKGVTLGVLTIRELIDEGRS